MTVGIWTATNDSYLRILRGLLPRGVLWTKDPARRLTKLLQGLADELVRVHNRTGALMTEADPQTTSELLPDWERTTGLPECPVYAPTAEADRRAELVAKLSAYGGQAADYFIGLANKIGATLTITDLYPIGWRNVWQAKTPEVTRFRAGSGKAGDRLIEWSDLGQRVRCLLSKYKPAHTRIWWTD